MTVRAVRLALGNWKPCGANQAEMRKYDPIMTSIAKARI